MEISRHPQVSGTDKMPGYLNRYRRYTRHSAGASYGAYNWRKYCGQVVNQKTYLPGSTFNLVFEVSM
jgi:hypothetical protein